MRRYYQLDNDLSAVVCCGKYKNMYVPQGLFQGSLLSLLFANSSVNNGLTIWNFAVKRNLKIKFNLKMYHCPKSPKLSEEFFQNICKNYNLIKNLLFS